MNNYRTSILLALSLVTVAPALAAPPSRLEPAWRFVQVIDTAGQHSRRATVSADGRIVAFDSRADVTPGAPGNTEENIELYLYDTVARSVTQVTDTRTADSRRASLSGDGRRVVFESNADLAPGNPGNPGNADGSFEIFLYDSGTSAFRQLTDTASSTCIRAAISDDGARVTFASNADLVAGGNPERNFEIFRYDAGTSKIVQVTTAASRHSRRPAINADGSVIVFDADADLTGGNPEKKPEIFLYREGAGLTQVTDAAGDSEFASISADGRLVAFQSTADLLPENQGNADGNAEIFLYHTDTGTLAQVTDSRAGESFGPAVDAGGRRVVFYSSADLARHNPDGNLEIFAYDTDSRSLTQVTDTRLGDSRRPRLTADGRRVVFDSSTDLTGGNRDRNQEVFLAASGPFFRRPPAGDEPQRQQHGLAKPQPGEGQDRHRPRSAAVGME